MGKEIRRRDLLKGMATSPVVATLGTGGLLSLLANRQAVAQGTVIEITGVTAGSGHVHTFTAGFRLRNINTETGVITGDIVGRTLATIATGGSPAQDHLHTVRMLGVQIGQSVNTSTDFFHAHSLQVD